MFSIDYLGILNRAEKVFLAAIAVQTKKQKKQYVKPEAAGTLTTYNMCVN
jgi:hypothetical protein